MPPHAILQTARSETPLTAKPAIIVCALSLTGFGSANRAKSNNRRND
jgi:hypothetical protein